MKKLLLLLLFIPLVFSCSKGETIKYNLNVSSNPINAGDLSPIGGQFDEGQEITLTAYPRVEFNFDKWTGSVSETSNPLKILMNSDKTVVANFTPKTPSKARYELTEVWKNIEVPIRSSLSDGCGGRYYRADGNKLWMDSYHHYSVDSLIIDFSKDIFTEGYSWGTQQKTKDIKLYIPNNTSAKRYIPSKIGYIKIIGDTINKRVFWEFNRYMYQNTKHLPIKYGDSNIDFTDLIYEGLSMCATSPRKINNNSDFVFFKKEDVTKTTSVREIPYLDNQANWKVGDTISFQDSYGFVNNYSIQSIKYLYD